MLERARARFKKDTRRADDIAQAMGVPIEPGRVKNWLDGRDVPRDPVLHDALMKALDLPETIGDVPLEVEDRPRRAKAQLRDNIEEAWEIARDACRDVPEVPPAGRMQARVGRGTARMPHPAIRADGHGVPTESYIGFPPRLYPGGQYGGLGYKMLDAILNETPNAHEFFAAFRERYYAGLTNAEAAEAMGCTNATQLYCIESGLNLPAQTLPDILPCIEAKAGAALAERFEQLVIDNRLAIIRAVQGDRVANNRVSKEHLNSMPTRYWRAVLAECAQRPPGDAAEGMVMSDGVHVLPVRYRSDYLRAVRGLYRTSAADVAESLGLEEANYRLRYENHGALLSPVMLQQMAEHFPEFDAAMYEGLPARVISQAPVESLHADTVQSRRNGPAATRA